ncbi:MAG: hypothetical protein ACRD1V_02450 [Vicinamibacterales bacterium]
MVDAFVLCAILAQTPQPFPRVAGSKPAPPPAAEPQTPGAPPAQPAVVQPIAPAGPPISTDKPSDATLGVEVYPGAEFLASYDAGKGQRYYLFGTNANFDVIVTYYRTLLKEKGDLVYDQPAVQEFDIGKYREDTMVFPPSVTVKDYTTPGSPGYLHVTPGKPPQRFKTIIQIVPAAPGR